MNKPWARYILIGLILAVGAALLVSKSFSGCNANDSNGIDTSLQVNATPPIAFDIVAQYPHDTAAYTEGLQIYNGKFYEGTGMENESTLQIADIKTGKVEKRHKYTDPKIFGEGIQVFKNKIYQLTWRNHVVYVYDINNIDVPVKTFEWPHEGWGMTNNGTELIISDGTPNIYFVDPETFTIKNTITIAEDRGNSQNINELEYIDGYIYANVWQTNDIFKIDPSNGKVIGKLSFPDMAKQYFADKITDRLDVMNGIAYDSTTKKMYVTGKRWPVMFEVKMK